MDKEHIYFENYADTWDRDRKENPEKLQFLLNLARIQAGASVLDAGCGTGVLLPYISRAVGEGCRRRGNGDGPRLFPANAG